MQEDPGVYLWADINPPQKEPVAQHAVQLDQNR